MRMLPPAGTPISVADIMASLRDVLSGDDVVKKFTEDFRNYFGVKSCFLTSSGRAALAILFKALSKLRPGKNEIILPAYTSFSVPAAAVKAGFKISLCDVDPLTLSLDIESLKKAITNSTLCVVPCHLYGYPSGMDAIREVARAYNIYIIDDAAQAMGAHYRGRFVGTLGDAGIFSLNRGKNITTLEGGVIVTNSSELAEKISAIGYKETGPLHNMAIFLKTLAMGLSLNPNRYWLMEYLPFLRLGESAFSPDFDIYKYGGFQASLGRKMLARLANVNKIRTENAGKIIKAIDKVRGKIESIKIVDGGEPVFLRLPIKYRGSFQDPIRFGIIRGYPHPLNEMATLKPYLRLSRQNFGGAGELNKTLWTLPTHNYLKPVDIETLTEYLKNSLN